MFGRATIRLGIGPHSSKTVNCLTWTDLYRKTKSMMLIGVFYTKDVVSARCRSVFNNAHFTLGLHIQAHALPEYNVTHLPMLTPVHDV